MENDDPMSRRSGPDAASDRVATYAERLAALPTDSVAGAFPVVEARDRPDPYNAFVSTFLADAPMNGPLSSLSLAVKENVAVAGVTATCGTDCFEWTPSVDAAVVERLRAAGAGVEATTNMDPFAFGTTGEWSAHGRTDNPAVEGRVPGGSSSGSGAAVAAGLVDAALGTDTAGSVRIPAAFCGVVGYKPTYGLVPTTGVVDLSPSNDHVGVLARDVQTTASVVETIAGREATRPASLAGPSGLSFADDLDADLPSLRVGIPQEFMAVTDDAVAARVEGALNDCIVSLGFDTEDVAFPEHEAAATVNDAQTLMEFADLLGRGQPLGTGRERGLREALQRAADRLTVPDRVRRAVETGEALLDAHPDAYGQSWDTRRRVIRRQQALFGGVDLLATPTMPMVAPEFDSVEQGGPTVMDTVANTAPFNCTGAPAVTIPCGDVRGAPVGIQFVAPPGADGFLLRVANAVEGVLQ
jgi:Asp-tRNA(Asn)/Glu-tRNA(Gln) amidotransferase A subunit family amidase